MPTLLIAALALSLAGPAAARPAVKLRLLGATHRYAPETGALFGPDGRALPRSRTYDDSKSLAFRIRPGAVAKLYTGPRYQHGDWKLEASRVADMGRREADFLASSAEAGTALPVLDRQEADELFAAVYAAPLSGVSAATRVKQGRYQEIAPRLEKLTGKLVNQRFRLGTFNPTQVYLPAGGDAVLIKAYTDDQWRPRDSRELLEDYYRERLRFFQALSNVYSGRHLGMEVSDGRGAVSLADITLLVDRAMRERRPLLVFYKDRVWDAARGRPGRVRPLQSLLLAALDASLEHDDFLKGYLRAYDIDARRHGVYRLDRMFLAAFAPLEG